MKTIRDLLKAFREATTLEERTAAAEKLIEIVRPLLKLFIAPRYTATPIADLDDLLQDVLLGIALGLPRCRAVTDAEFWAYCYQVARNKIADRYRRRGLDTVALPDESDWRELVDLEGASKTPSPEVRHDIEVLMERLAELKPPCRHLLWMHYILELDYAEIADTLGIATDAVRMRIKRCLTLARELIEKEPEK